MADSTIYGCHSARAMHTSALGVLTLMMPVCRARSLSRSEVPLNRLTNLTVPAPLVIPPSQYLYDSPLPTSASGGKEGERKEVLTHSGIARATMARGAHSTSALEPPSKTSAFWFPRPPPKLWLSSRRRVAQSRLLSNTRSLPTAPRLAECCSTRAHRQRGKTRAYSFSTTAVSASRPILDIIRQPRLDQRLSVLVLLRVAAAQV